VRSYNINLGRFKTLLQIEKLNKSYGERAVLKDLTLHIQAGEIYGLLGPKLQLSIFYAIC